MTVVIVATITAVLLVVLLDSGDDSLAAEADPPTVHEPTALRSAPAADTAIAARLEAGAEVRILGRNPNADWLFVESAANPDDRGWIERALVEPVPRTELIAIWTAPAATSTAVGPNATATPTVAGGQPTFTPTSQTSASIPSSRETTA